MSGQLYFESHPNADKSHETISGLKNHKAEWLLIISTER